MAGHACLLIALAALADDRHGLDEWETAARRAAPLRHAEVERVVPLLEHLLAQLGRVHPDDGCSVPALERMHQAGLDVHHLLSALVSATRTAARTAPERCRERGRHALVVLQRSAGAQVTLEPLLAIASGPQQPFR